MPIIFITILYSLVMGRFAGKIISYEILDSFLFSLGLKSRVINILILVLFYLPIYFLQLFLIIFLILKNRSKFIRKTFKFKILLYLSIFLLTLTIVRLIPYISITFFRNYQFSGLWYNQIYFFIYFLDIIVPFGQLFFVYIFWQFWKIWFGKSSNIGS